MSFPVRKISWDAVLGTAAVLGLFIYAVQAYYLHHTLKTAQGTIELQVFSILSEAESKLYDNREAHAHYKSLAHCKSLAGANAKEEDYVIIYGEIYNYLNLLDNISVLYLKGRLDRTIFPVIYREHVLEAARVIRQGSESERKHYPSILKVAQQLKGLGEE